MSNRFDYVKYTELSVAKQNEFKEKFIELESLIEKYLDDGRAKSLVLTKLEEAYMWVGKSIRDSQPDKTLQEDRTNG